MARTLIEDLESTIDNTELPEPEERPKPSGASAASLTQVEPGLYELKEELGRGGMGRVIQAHDNRLDREVAIKELLPIGREALPRFIREAMVTAKLQHPGILPIYEAGRWPSGKPFYSMKLISGRSLGQALESCQTLEERLRFLPNVLAASEAVAYAHAQSVIHRDLKPDNIMLGAFGETIVIDWGLAKELGDLAPDPSPASTEAGRPSTEAVRQNGFTRRGEAERSEAGRGPKVTAHGHIIGTPAYMPLEQAHGETLDARADVYSLGAILYELLSGSAPYTGSSTQEVLLALHQQPPAPLSTLAPRAPKELFAIVEKAMARQREARYPTAKELAHDLRRFQEGQLVAAYQYTKKEKLLRWLRQNRAAVTATLAALFAIAGVAVYSFIKITDQRDIARAAQASAEKAKAQETLRADELTILQARDALTHDPTEALSWLSQLSQGSSQWSAARILAADAKERGVSKRLSGHTGAINAVKYSPDGTLIASVSDDGTIILRDTKTYASKRLDAHQGEIFALAFSPDGRELATAGSDHVVKRWKVECLLQDKRDCATSLEGHTSEIFSLAFSPDSQWLASVSADTTLRVWGATEYVCYGHQAQVWKVAFSPDGLTLATAGWDNTVRLWDRTRCEASSLVAQKSNLAADARPTSPSVPIPQAPSSASAPPSKSSASEALLHQRPVIGLSFAPDGKRLASVDVDGGAYLWDLSTKQQNLFYTHPGGFVEVVYSHDGKLLAAGGADGSVLLWKTSELDLPSEPRSAPKPKTLSPKKPSPPPPVRPSPGGSIDPITENRPGVTSPDSPLENPFLKKKPVSPSEASPPERTVTPKTPAVIPSNASQAQAAPAPSAAPKEPKEPTTRAPFLSLQAHADAVGVLLFSFDDKRLFLGSYDNTASLFEIERGEWHLLIGHSDRVYGLALSPDGQTLATASWDRDVRLWDIQARQRNQITLPVKPLGAVLALPTGEALTAGGSRLYFWKVGEESPKAIENNALVTSLALSPDGERLAVGGIEGSLRLYETRSKAAKLLLSSPPQKKEISLLAFSPDGALLASAGTNGVSLWSLDGKVTALEGLTAKATALTFSAKGKYLAASDASGNVYLWEVSTRSLQKIRAHQEPINALAFSPDESQLASASDDHLICLLALSSPSCKPLKGHSLRVTTLAFSPDGSFLASGGEDRSVRMWSLTGGPALIHEEHKGEILGLSFVGAKTLLSLSADGTARLYETTHWQSRALSLGGAVIGATASKEAGGLFVLSSSGALRYFEDNLPREEAPLREWCKAALQ